MFSWLFLIRSFSYLQVTRTYICAWMSSNFGQIPLLTTELAALERLKNRCRHFFSVAIDQIHFKFVGNEDMHNISNEFEFRPDWTTNYGVICPWTSKNTPKTYNGKDAVSTLSRLFKGAILWILAGNDDMHKSLDEFEFQPDPTTDLGVSCPWASKKSMLPLFLGCYW